MEDLREDFGNKSDRYEVIQRMAGNFWKSWSEEVTPEWIIRKKWHETSHNLKVGDIVLVHDKTPIKDC